MQRTRFLWIVIASTAAFAITNVHATIDFCVTVRHTPDGFVALRDGPGVQFRMKARLKPGETLIADTAQCSKVAGKTMCDETRQWTFINHVPRLDDGKAKLEGPEDYTQGWVLTKLTKNADRCTRDLHGG